MEEITIVKKRSRLGLWLLLLLVLALIAGAVAYIVFSGGGRELGLEPATTFISSPSVDRLLA
jgi:hypothetical protein